MCELRIVKHALHHNIRLVQRLAGDARVIGVVKGNGYGLGLGELASHLVEYGVRHLAVSELEEALTLRRLGISAEIMLLSPLCDGGELEEALRAGVILCVDSWEGAEAAERAARRLDCTGKAQLCVDTGFGRYGFSCSSPSRSGRPPVLWSGCGWWAPIPTCGGGRTRRAARPGGRSSG